MVADLLLGDRFLVQDWSAIDNPRGCGLPGGSGNCPLDIRTLLPRSDVNGNLGVPYRPGPHPDQQHQRAWTPVGGGLKGAKDALVAAPGSTNPKHIFLLSDGQENVNPLYAVKNEPRIRAWSSTPLPLVRKRLAT